MNFLGRAIRYCWRQKIRSAILLLVFTLLASSALIALSVGHAAVKGADAVKQTVGASIRIEIDSGNSALYGSGAENEWGTAYQYQGDYITQEVIDAIAKVDGVVDCSAESEGGYWGAGVNFAYFTGAFNIDFTGGYGQSVPYTVTLNSELSANFLNGTYTLEEGRHIRPDDSYAVLISRELADKNGLSVGDGITMYDLDSDSENTFEIVGIFGGTEGMSKDAMMADGIPANQGYIDMNSYNEIFHREAMALGSLDVYLSSAENIQEILYTIQNLPELQGKTFVYSTDTENFAQISHPLSSLQAMMDAAVIGIAMASTAIIALLLILWTRSRKKEAGILLAMGRSKGEIVLQFLAENILLVIPSAAASFALAALLAEEVGAYLVRQTASEVTGLAVAIHAADMAAVYGVGAPVLILSVLLSAVTVIRWKPGVILSQMD